MRSLSASDAYVMISIGAAVKLIKAQVCSTTICYYSYDFEGVFSLNTANSVKGAIFRPEKNKIYFYGSLSQVFNQSINQWIVGYVMELDYLSTTL